MDKVAQSNSTLEGLKTTRGELLGTTHHQLLEHFHALPVKDIRVCDPDLKWELSLKNYVYRMLRCIYMFSYIGGNKLRLISHTASMKGALFKRITFNQQ